MSEAQQTRIERLRQEVIEAARGFGAASPALARALERLDRAERKEVDDLYVAAVREWVARRLRARGHDYSRDDVRNVRFGLEEGWGGTDVTPGDDDYAAMHCDLRVQGKWQSHSEAIDTIDPVDLVFQCAETYYELLRE